MNKRLETNLYTKKELRFNKNGKFRILMMSDLQETLEYDRRSLKAIEDITDNVRPELVIFGGDNCNGHVIKTAEELQKYLKIFTEPLEKRGIPWAHVFGNHDHDCDCNDYIQQEIYEGFPYCVSKHTDEDVHGVTNFVLPIKGFDSEKIKFNVWGLDTNNLIKEINDPVYIGDIEKDCYVPNRPKESSCWDILRFNQLMWYWNSSEEIEKYNGESINSLMVMHIAPWEFGIVRNNLETGRIGNIDENLGLGLLNSGIFAACLQRGDIRCIASGHTHMDNFEGTYCGIKMCLDSCVGFSPYGIDELRGGRIFDIDENNTSEISTQMIYALDIKAVTE